MAETKRLTPERLAEIRERAEEATEGPWSVEEVEYKSSAIMAPGYLYGEMCVISVKSDADFIAKSREDIPKLLAEIERLKSENKYSEIHNGISELIERWDEDDEGNS